MRILIPACPVAFYVERDNLGPMWGVTFSREDGLQFHFGDWSVIASTE